MPSPIPSQTKRTTREHRGVKYWKWPRQKQWLFPRGRGSEQSIHRYLDNLPPDELATIAASSAKIIADLDTPSEATQ